MKCQDVHSGTWHHYKVKRVAKTRYMRQGYSIGKQTNLFGNTISVSDSAMLKHILISGDVGSGANSCVEQLLVQQTTKGRGWIHFDMRSDWHLLESLKTTASGLGRADELHVLDLHHLHYSHNFDFLAGGSPAQKANRLLHLLTGTWPRPVDRHELQKAQDLLAFTVAVVDATGNSTNIGEVCRLLTMLLDDQANRHILDLVPLLHPERASLERTFLGFSSAESGASQFVQCLNKNLQQLKVTWELALLTSQAPDVLFSDVLAHNRMLYVRIPALQLDLSLGYYHAILQACLDSLEVRRSTPLRTRVPFIITIPDSADGVVIGGSYNMVQGLALEASRSLGVAYVGVGVPELNRVHTRANNAPTLRTVPYTQIHFKSGRPGQFTLTSANDKIEGRLD